MLDWANESGGCNSTNDRWRRYAFSLAYSLEYVFRSNEGEARIYHMWDSSANSRRRDWYANEPELNVHFVHEGPS